jgi:hypothetical protein
MEVRKEINLSVKKRQTLWKEATSLEDRLLRGKGRQREDGLLRGRLLSGANFPSRASL